MKRNKNHPVTPGNENEPTSFLNQQNFSGNLSLEDLRELYKEMEKEQILSSYTFPAKPSSDGYYHVYLPAAGGRKQIKAKNLEKLKEKVYEYEKGVNGSTRKTFKDVFEAAQQEKLVYVKDEEKLVSVNNTICTVRSNYKRFFEGTAFETMFIDEISKTDIEKHCFAVLKKMDLKKRAFMNMRNILSSAFKLAYEQYWIFDNPYTRIDFKKYNDMLARDTAVHMRVHSSEDIDRMLDFLHQKQAAKPWYIPAYALELQIIMGLRRGEIAPLRWSDVKKNSIRICREQLTDKSNKGFVIVDHTKAYKDREFPLTTTLSEFITRLRAVHDEFYPTSPYLFPDVSQKKQSHQQQSCLSPV